jgi:hypothetical protein
MSKLDKIVEDLSSLTVLEAAELSKLLEEKWGVSAAAPVAVAAAAGAAPAAAVEEQTEFTIWVVDGPGWQRLRTTLSSTLLGHCKIERNVQFLGSKVDDALEIECAIARCNNVTLHL